MSGEGEIEYQTEWLPVDPTLIPEGFVANWGPEEADDGRLVMTYTRPTGEVRQVIASSGSSYNITVVDAIEVEVVEMVTAWRQVTQWEPCAPFPAPEEGP